MADWPPKKHIAFNVHFPIYDNDGDLVTAAAALDSEVSIDHGTFADCTNEATEIATSSGVYYLTLTLDEMNGDIITTITKTSTAAAKTAVNVMYTATRQLTDLAFPTTSGRSIDVDANGGVEVGAIQADVITAAAIANGAIDAATFAAGAIDATAIANGAIDAATFAAGAIDAAAIADAAIDNATFAADVGSTAYATNIIALAADKAMVNENLDHLAKTATAAADMTTEVADNTILSRILGNGDTSTFDPSTDGLHAAGVDIDAILLDTGTTLDGRIPAALVGGRMDASVGAMATDVITATALAASAATEIADAILSRDIDQVEATAALDSLCTAILKAVSRVRDNAGTLEVYRTNGVTLHMSQTVTTNAALDAISELTAGV
jgi:hypothetical protein